MYTDIFYNSQIIDDLMQIAEELIAVINNWLNEHIQEIIHIVYLLISELADKYYFDTELQNDGSRTVFDTSPRSPPQERISVKIQVYYIFFCLFIFPHIAKGIMYCENLIFTDYLLKLIAFLLTFFGVCL